MDTVVFDYRGPVPSEEFYEEFAQTTYWQKQRVVVEGLPASGIYYIVVFEESQGGKYSLAVGEVEDFTPIDFVTVLQAAWFEVKLFFEDYLSIAAAISVLGATVALPAVVRMQPSALNVTAAYGCSDEHTQHVLSGRRQ